MDVAGGVDVHPDAARVVPVLGVVLLAVTVSLGADETAPASTRYTVGRDTLKVRTRSATDSPPAWSWRSWRA
ncbi:MAG: hypothetical protein JWO67_4240 [Streptosporangiaceae bacterium]|nr:hypothetical protein [Streptosporangiaceae bacterium]